MSEPLPLGWVPVRVAPAGGRLIADCRPIDLGQLRAAFFDEDVNQALGLPFPAVFPAFADLEALAGSQELAGAPDPAGLILHSSRCGSSLLVRLLQRPPCRVVAEPAAITLLLRHSAGRPLDERAALLRALVALFCRPAPGAAPAPTFVKFEAWESLDLPVIRRAFPTVPWIFIYRDPVEVIVSQLALPHGPLASRIDLAWRLGISQAEALATPAEELCARLLGQTYAAALAHLDAAPALLSYPELPGGALELLPRHFGLAWTAADAAQARRCAQFHAKHPSEYFADDTLAKRRAAGPAVSAAAQRWAVEPYRALEAARLARVTRITPYA